ncbi:MAG TPA: wax ester/triacylglycerol synthase domain-containing protein [Acidimicrobiales bacterium]
MDERSFPPRLSASDSLLWRIASDPVLRTPILVVGLLDRSPSPEGLEATVDRAVAALPRLRQRIAGPPLGLGRPRWEDAGEPSLAHHVRRVRAPGGGVEDVLEVAQPDAVAAFDPARPPWTLTVVDGLEGDRAAVVLRFHHAVTDGVGGIEIADVLFDRARRPPRTGGRAAGTPPAPGPPQASPAPPGGGLAGEAVDAATRLSREALSATRDVVEAAARRPGDLVAAPLRLGRSAARLLAPARRGGSPALAGRSLDRWLNVTERPMARLHRAAHAAGGTVNDVLLGSVGGALAAYHRAQGQPVRTVRITMPISIRRPGDPMGGNRFVPARFTLPVDDPDPRMRVKIAGGIARRWRAEPALGATDLLAGGLNMLPGPVVTRLFGDMLRSIDADVVDVPGLGRRAFLGGARIDRLWAFAPPGGAALSITLVSHDEVACIGLSCDRLAVTDPALLATCLDEALDEVLALGGPSGTPRRTARPARAARPARPARAARPSRRSRA